MAKITNQASDIMDDIDEVVLDEIPTGKASATTMSLEDHVLELTEREKKNGKSTTIPKKLTDDDIALMMSMLQRQAGARVGALAGKVLFTHWYNRYETGVKGLNAYYEELTANSAFADKTSPIRNAVDVQAVEKERKKLNKQRLALREKASVENLKAVAAVRVLVKAWLKEDFGETVADPITGHPKRIGTDLIIDDTKRLFFKGAEL
jgi:hypothetical protein